MSEATTQGLAGHSRPTGLMFDIWDIRYLSVFGIVLGKPIEWLCVIQTPALNLSYHILRSSLA